MTRTTLHIVISSGSLSLAAARFVLEGVCLVIDDEPHVRRAVVHALAEVFERTIESGSVVEALDLAAARKPALIVLDLALPDGEGLDVCRTIRTWSTCPIIILSARHSEREKVALLEAGADDYVTKPFSSVELRARARAQVRRALLATRNGAARIEVDGLTVDLAARLLWRSDRQIHLTPTEWGLLRAFLHDAGKTLTHAQLFRSVWTRSSGDPQAYLRVYVAQLRRKIERDPVRPVLILTEPGVGYRFTAID